MLKEFRDIIDLIAQCPEDFQRDAAKSLSIQLAQHEDWLSLGCPDRDTYSRIKLDIWRTIHCFHTRRFDGITIGQTDPGILWEGRGSTPRRTTPWQSPRIRAKKPRRPRRSRVDSNIRTRRARPAPTTLSAIRGTRRGAAVLSKRRGPGDDNLRDVRAWRRAPPTWLRSLARCRSRHRQSTNHLSPRPRPRAPIRNFTSLVRYRT